MNPGKELNITIRRPRPKRSLFYSNSSLEAQLDVNLRCGRLKTNSISTKPNIRHK
uniref:Uncharacterized protein n=1 Tax=Utricularia reniformis TaxID=192314 RepID=A0A1Y0AYS5_9LAMI|nr:hypothetical protein AEK19_MT0698 [Utricularia reniformis]ART30303.1 hypothetical protein AEK19_MT0698 [Utricularia reniformis]